MKRRDSLGTLEAASTAAAPGTEKLFTIGGDPGVARGAGEAHARHGAGEGQRLEEEHDGSARWPVLRRRPLASDVDRGGRRSGAGILAGNVCVGSSEASAWGPTARDAAGFA
jgi:hypothetical protein